jgi:hypothetical protein
LVQEIWIFGHLNCKTINVHNLRYLPHRTPAAQWKKRLFPS